MGSSGAVVKNVGQSVRGCHDIDDTFKEFLPAKTSSRKRAAQSAKPDYLIILLPLL